MKKWIGLVLFVLTFATSSFASSNRTDHRFGIHVGLIGDPFPTLIGANLNYNILDWFRVTAGYGTITATRGSSTLSATTIGFGGRFFIPGWSFSPVAGFSWANVSMTLTGPQVAGLDVGGFTVGTASSHTYISMGIDWQTGLGLNLGAGYNLSMLDGVGGLPYVNIGWYF